MFGPDKRWSQLGERSCRFITFEPDKRSHVEPMAAADAEAYLGGWPRDPRAYARGGAVLEAGDDVAGLEGAMDAWERPVLILHGEDDLCTPLAQAVEFYNALVEAGCETELVVFPREGHGWTERGHQIDGWYRMRDWLARYV